MEAIKDDLKVLNIDDKQEITKDYVTAKYKNLAKVRHPDKEGGNTGDFQRLLSAYRSIIQFLEDNQDKEPFEEKEKDFETEFFMKHNIMKECTTSYVVYIQDQFVDRWRKVLERHITVHKMDKTKAIFKTGLITVTLYVRPKKDPRSKLHIQSGDQS